MLKRSMVLLTLFLGVSLAALGAGEHGDSHHAPAGAEPEIQLSLPLQRALAEEMVAIQNAMMDLVASISAGEWPEVAKLARQIEGSYIMKQKLSAEQMEELHRALPAGFQELDGSFHRMDAAGLRQPARAGHLHPE